MKANDQVFHKKSHYFGRLVFERIVLDTVYWLVEFEIPGFSKRTLRREFWDIRNIILVESEQHKLSLRLKYSD
jgi:hypothetical protein